MNTPTSTPSISPLQRALDELQSSTLDAMAACRVLADALENGIANPGSPPARSEAHGHRADAYTLGERFNAVLAQIRDRMPAPALADRAADLLPRIEDTYGPGGMGTADVKSRQLLDEVERFLREIVAGRLRPAEHTITFTPSGVPGVLDGVPVADIDRILFAVFQTHDSSELWAHARRDPDAFRAAVRRAIGAGPAPAHSPLVDDHAYTVKWSPEDRQFVGTVAGFPSLSYLADTRTMALHGIAEVTRDVIADMKASGEPLPTSFEAAPAVRDQHWVSAIKYQDAIKRDVEQGLTSDQIRDEIISNVGMMASARTPEMQARYDAALEREALARRPDPTRESVNRQVEHDLAVTAARLVLQADVFAMKALNLGDLRRMAKIVLAHAGEGPVTPPDPSHARPLTEQQLAKALSCSADEWCKSVTGGTLFDLWCSYVGVPANTYESALAYGAFRAAREYFSTNAPQRYQPAEIVYTAPAPKAEASPDLQTAIGAMDSALGALVNELAPDVVQNLRTRLEDVLRHTNNQLLKPSHELEALRNFHENVSERLRSLRNLDSPTKRALGLARLEDDVLTNKQALMKPRQLDAIGVTVNGTNPPVPNVPSTATFVETPGLFGTGTISSPTVVASTVSTPEITGIAGQGGRMVTIKRVDVDSRTEERRKADDRAREEVEARVPVTRRPRAWYTAGPPPDGRSVDTHLDELAYSSTDNDDWTAADGYANRSPVFKKLSKLVADIILNSAHDLISGRSDMVGGLVMAQLAHVHGVRPISEEERRVFRIASRVVSRGMHRRTHAAQRQRGNCGELMVNDVEILRQLAEAVEKLGGK